MATPVYSTLFQSFTLEGETTSAAAVPSGYVAVVRDITADFSETTGDSGGRLIVTTDEVTICSFYWPSWCQLTQGWEGRSVVPGPSDISVAFASLTATLNIRISGYLLTLP